MDRDTWILTFDSDWQPTDSADATFFMRASLTEDGIPLLGTADILVEKATGEELVGFSVSWQEDDNAET